MLRVGKRKVAFIALALLTFSLAFLAWTIGGTDLLLAFTLISVVAGSGLATYAVVQAERRIVSSPSITAASRYARAARDALVEDSGGSLHAIDTRLTNVEKILMSRLQSPGEQAESLLRAMNAVYRRMDMELGRRLSRSDQTVARLFNHVTAEFDALMQVHRRTGLADPTPLMGGWALSPRALLQAIDVVQETNASLVLECGSGTSTIFLAEVIQLAGNGRLVALEHLEEYATQTALAIKNHGLDTVAEVRFAPLETYEIDGEAYEWYAASSVQDLEGIEVLLVDGPPGSTGPRARYPAYPVLRDKLASRAQVLVDDLRRSDEASIVDVWIEDGRLKRRPTHSDDVALLQYESGIED